MIELRDVHKRFNGKPVLAGVTFTVSRGKALAIMGPSGSGKSVMLKHIIGLLRPDAGDVHVEGRSVPALDAHELRALRRNMGYLFQHGALINWLTVFDNVALPLRETTRMDETAVREKVEAVLELMQLPEAAGKFPGEISGGMMKRVGLARALVTEPSIILYDEPEAGLDPEMSASVTRVIRRLQKELDMTSIIVTHSLKCATGAADEIALFDGGRIVVQGPPDDVLNSSLPRVREFLDLDED